MQIIHT